MYFKKLEIVGFKSFFNKTVLDFEPGITAIVGPNGCGKSNIFDSIRWVLGEQSVKSLRGSEMQDVIFNGTDTKEPLSMAEVTLIFDNSKRFFNVDHHEISITRRIFRSGESEYLLNKTQVRLKDILDLLMGTGIGAESYSLVAQGKIDLILSSRPEDRRLVFDEAAGIIKYKTHKKEALRKLEETEQNLLRVNDIVNEVRRQISSLERQANKARRYKEVFEELRSHEMRLAILQKNELSRQRNEILKQLAEMETKEQEFSNAIKTEESKISERQAELKALEDEILSIKNEILNLNSTISRDNEHINFNGERISELDTTQQYLKGQIEQTQSRLKLDEEKLNNIKKEYEGIKKNVEDKTRILQEKEKELENINLTTKISLENIAHAKRGILELVSKIVSAKNDIADSSSRQQIYLARKKRLDIEKAKVNEEKAVIEDNLHNINQEVEVIIKNFGELNDKLSSLKNELGVDSQYLTKINLDINELEKEKLSLQSQKDFLDKLRTKYEGINESMNAVVYLDNLPRENVNGLVVKIKDYVNLSNEDKAYFSPARIKISGEAKPIDLDTQKITEQINRILEKIDILKNDKTSKEARIEELNKLIQETQQEARNLEMVLVNKKAQQQTTLEQFNKIKEEEDIIAVELQDVQTELVALEKKLATLQLHLGDLELEHKNKEELISNEQNNISLNTGLKEKVLVIITQTKTELDALAKRSASDETTFKIFEDTYRQDKEILGNLESQIREAKEKQEALTGEIKDLEADIQNAKKNIQDKEILLKEVEDKHKELSSEGSDVLKKIESNRKELDGVKNKLHELQMQHKDLDFKYLSIKERMLQNYKIDIDIMQDVSNVKQQGQQQQQQRLNDGVQDASLPDSEQENNIDTLMQRIQELKDKLDSYGTVNLVAIEEYDELKKRYDFLSQQQSDLLNAKESLHEAILKINRTTKKMFLETFEKVRQEFRNYFRLLFNGGDAQIFLIDEQDPLESGIEIICRPPGKKLQNVLLLSGGEKSMSAIALIFAVFKVKPSPFCVLDEIDAALDEANVDRFGRILQEFTKDSQFIVITHNKKTIVNADIMYGITMEESGVSKIVSVKFAQQKTDRNRESGVAVAQAEAEAESIS